MEQVQICLETCTILIYTRLLAATQFMSLNLGALLEGGLRGVN